MGVVKHAQPREYASSKGASETLILLDYRLPAHHLTLRDSFPVVDDRLRDNPRVKPRRPFRTRLP